jgi:hypothetical protein
VLIRSLRKKLMIGRCGPGEKVAGSYCREQEIYRGHGENRLLLVAGRRSDSAGATGRSGATKSRSLVVLKASS